MAEIPDNLDLPSLPTSNPLKMASGPDSGPQMTQIMSPTLHRARSADNLAAKRAQSSEPLKSKQLDSGDDQPSDLSDYEKISSDVEDDAKKRHPDNHRATFGYPRPSIPTRAKLTRPASEEETIDFNSRGEAETAFMDLRAQLKLALRENREQSLKLREYREEHSKLREAYFRVRNELAEDPHKLSKAERNRFHEHFQLMESHVSYLSQEQEKRDAHIEMLTKQTRDANAERDEQENNARKLHRQLKDVQRDLTECKDDLLRLQPTSEVADNQIGDRFASLCQQITSWVDDQTEDADALEDRFEQMKTVEALNMDPILGVYLNENHVRLIRDLPDALPLLIQHLVHCCLEQYVLGNGIYFYGLDIRNIGLLKEVERGLKLLEPARDVTTLRRWRSETLLGLSRSEEFSTARTQQGKTLAKALYFALERMLRGPEIKVDDDGWEAFHKQIVLPAIEISTSMRLSMTDYELVLNVAGSPKDASEPKVANFNEIQHYQMIDCATSKVIRPDSLLKVAEDGRIGIDLLTVSPALMRTKDEGIHRLVLAKPTVLIKLDEPMGKRQKGITKLTNWTTSWLGGDSSVD